MPRKLQSFSAKWQALRRIAQVRTAKPGAHDPITNMSSSARAPASPLASYVQIMRARGPTSINSNLLQRQRHRMISLCTSSHGSARCPALANTCIKNAVLFQRRRQYSEALHVRRSTLAEPPFGTERNAGTPITVVISLNADLERKPTLTLGRPTDRANVRVRCLCALLGQPLDLPRSGLASGQVKTIAT